MINYLAVLVAAIAAFIVGALWYGPFFGKPWRHLMGVREGSMSGANKNSLASAMIGGFVATLVLVYIFALVMNALQITQPLQAAWLALLLAIGFIATTMINSVFYEHRPWKLYFINVSHYIVALIVASLVLAWWPW